MDMRHGEGDMKYMDGTVYEVCPNFFFVTQLSFNNNYFLVFEKTTLTLFGLYFLQSLKKTSIFACVEKTFFFFY